MNSRKKRKDQHPMVEDLIVTEAQREVGNEGKVRSKSSSTISDHKYDPRIPELDDNADDLVIEDRSKAHGCCMNETFRNYIITISTFLFAVLSLGLGVWLIWTQKQIQTGAIAIIIGILLLVPASYGLWKIIHILKGKKGKQGSRKEQDGFDYAYVDTKV